MQGRKINGELDNFLKSNLINKDVSYEESSRQYILHVLTYDYEAWTTRRGFVRD